MINLLNLPKELKNGFVEVSMIANKDGVEYWNRNFIKNDIIMSTFNTKQELFNEELIEYYKFFYFIFKKKIDGNDKFELILTEFGVHIFNIKFKIPKIFSPSLIAYTITTDIGWKFGNFNI
jgi:hypothetical protein